MQIICSKRRDKKGRETEYYVAHPSFSVPWGVNTQGWMIWGEVKFEVMLPRKLVEKFNEKTDFWTSEQNGVSYFADFFVENDQLKGISLEFRNKILSCITAVIEDYITENNSGEIKEISLCEHIKKSRWYDNMCKDFKSPQDYATEVKEITVVQVKKGQKDK